MDLQPIRKLQDDVHPLGVSIVMPCLNEAESLAHCIANAREALRRIEARYGLGGEIIVADNGSTDGSQALAASLGARVVDVPAKGYGAALIGGFEAAFGEYLIMGDADGSYDFTDGVAMVGELLAGADVCMGSRFRGGIAPGAMPWKNRYIGNPVLTGILNLFFRAGIGDAHCGLRAITRDSLQALRLTGSGMEFASEMVIKASLKKLRMAETPAKLLVDLRDRPPHLRPWRDGWRHLRYLVMLSPTWAFGMPAALAIGVALAILGIAILHQLAILPGAGPFGASWTILGGFLLTTGHFASLMAIATHLAGVRAGYRLLRPSFDRIRALMTLETMLAAGFALMAVAAVMFVAIAWQWRAGDYAAPVSVLPLVVAASTGAIGMQTIFGGIVMAILSGHDSSFIPRRRQSDILR